MSGVRVLVLDDVANTRDSIAEALSERKYSARAIETSASLLEWLHECDAIILDVELGRNDPTVAEVLDLARARFPDVSFPHERFAKDVGCGYTDVADGKYLALLVLEINKSKSIDKPVKIIVLTGHSDDLVWFPTHGITDVVLKQAPEKELTKRKKNFAGLIDELEGFLRDVGARPPAVVRRPPPGEGVKKPIDATSERSAGIELGNFMDSLRSGVSLQEVLGSELDKWRRKSIPVRAEVLYLNQESMYLERIAQVGMDGTLQSLHIREGRAESQEGMGLCAFAARYKKSVLSPEVKYDRRYLAVTESDTTQSELVIPLAFQDKVVGVLNLESDTPYAFDNAHVSYYEGCSGILALLVELETYRDEEGFQNKTIQSLQSAPNENELFEQLLSAVVDRMGSTCLGCVLVPSGDLDRLRVVANKGLLGISVGSEVRLSSLGIIKKAVENPEGSLYWTKYRTESSGHADAVGGEIPYVELAPGIKSELVIKMKSGRDLLAIVDVESRDPVITERYRRAIDRVVQFATTLLSRLRSVGIHQHQQGVADALRGVSTELHAARGAFDIFLAQVADNKENRNLSAVRAEIKRRLGDVARLVESFLAPAETIELRPVLQSVLPYSQQVGVSLTIEPGLDVRTTINPTGVRWILENLLLNTNVHGHVGARPEASLTLRRIGDSGAALEYWDNGAVLDVTGSQAPERSEGGRGLKDIDALCKHFGWKHESFRHNGGGLAHRFTFAVTGQPEHAQ